MLLAQLFVVPCVTGVFRDALDGVEGSIQNARAKFIVSVYHIENAVVFQVLYKVESLEG